MIVPEYLYHRKKLIFESTKQANIEQHIKNYSWLTGLTLKTTLANHQFLLISSTLYYSFDIAMYIETEIFCTERFCRSTLFEKVNLCSFALLINGKKST